MSKCGPRNVITLGLVLLAVTALAGCGSSTSQEGPSAFVVPDPPPQQG